MTMAEFPHANHLQMDADMYDQSTVVGNGLDYRHKLKKVDEELLKRDVESLKFLCRDVIPAATQEDIWRGIDLFVELETRGKLGPLNLNYLVDCLMKIQRKDLLRKLGVDAAEFSDRVLPCGEEVSPYRKLLFEIAEDLTKRELSTLTYLVMPYLNLTKMKASKLKTAFQVISAMEHGGCLSGEDVTLLGNLLTQAGRSDLADKALHYQETGHLDVTGLDMNDEIVKPPLTPCLSGGGPVTLQSLPQENPAMGPMGVRIPMEPEQTRVTPMVPSVFSQPDLRSTYSSNFNYGPEGEDLPNIAVSLDEARQNPFLLSSASLMTSGQQALPEQMQHLHLNDLDLPSYKMDRKPRGYCLIINNFKFYKIPDDPDSRKMPDRFGTDVDAKALEKVFQDLNFVVLQRDNLTSVDMVRECTTVAMDEQHHYLDCFACCILTHGVKDHLYGTDGRMTPINDISSCFKAMRCPGLRGKPKLFFIQACQGREKQMGYPLEMDAPPVEDVETIPNEADFLMGYATVPGFVSYRSKVNGSWYITTLCDNLSKYGKRYDLLSIMTKVNEEVSAANAAMQDGRYKQIPAPMTTLRKKVYFR